MNINQIKPYPNNPKIHTVKQLKQIAKSIKQFDWQQPIVVDKQGVIIVGHGRYFAYQKYKDEMKLPEPMIMVSKLTPQLAKAYRIADNKTNESDWDNELLISELKKLEQELLEATGFDEDVFLEPEEREEKMPEIPKTTKIKLGDIYQLGRHRLMCGDSTSSDDVKKLMQDQKAKICFTSPPYWLGFEYEQEKNLEEILMHIDKQAEQMSKVVKSKIIINTANIASVTKAKKITGKKQPALLVDWWQDALNRNKFLLRHIRIWAKAGEMRPSTKSDSVDMHWEYIETFTNEDGDAGFVANFYNEAEKFAGQNKLGRFAKGWATSGIWTDIKGNARSDGHVAVYPVALPYRNILMYTNKDDLVYEPYAGSGTNFIACEMTKRVCCGMELIPAYVELVIKRWEEYTGEKAKKI